jgi:hypothetical protein
MSTAGVHSRCHSLTDGPSTSTSPTLCDLCDLCKVCELTEHLQRVELPPNTSLVVIELFLQVSNSSNSPTSLRLTYLTITDFWIVPAVGDQHTTERKETLIVLKVRMARKGAANILRAHAGASASAGAAAQE